MKAVAIPTDSTAQSATSSCSTTSITVSVRDASEIHYGVIRWYEPVAGRWLSNDPIGISGGLNQYVFCGDNPVNGRDPDGLAVVQISGTGRNGEPLSLWIRNPSTAKLRESIEQFKKGGIQRMSIDAHGSSRNVNFGGAIKATKDYLKQNKENGIDYDDETCFIKHSKDYFALDAAIDVWACRSAEGDENIAQALSKHLPGRTVRGWKGIGVAFDDFVKDGQNYGRFGSVRTYMNGVAQ